MKQETSSAIHFWALPLTGEKASNQNPMGKETDSKDCKTLPNKQIKTFELFSRFYHLLPEMDFAMLKEFLICGIGMAIDISGSQYIRSELFHPTANEAIASDWKQVGNLIHVGIANERPMIEAEIARQLQFKLD